MAFTENRMSIQLPPPRHLRSPGDDGYRTPTIEDAEKDLALQDSALSVPTGTRTREAHSSALEALHRYRTCKSEERAGGVDEEEEAAGIPSRDRTAISLGWKQRVRHLTWAFFTLTMATGGIANVLYTSKADPIVLWNLPLRAHG